MDAMDTSNNAKRVGRATHRRRRLTGSRVLCVSRDHVLLVEHQDPITGEQYWVLPGGGREPGETFEQAASREVMEETGVNIRLVRRLRVPSAIDATYALFLAEAVAHTEAAPTVDLSTEVYLQGAAWYPITPDNPLGPLSPQYWGYLAPRLRRRLKKDAKSPESKRTQRDRDAGGRRGNQSSPCQTM